MRWLLFVACASVPRPPDADPLAALNAERDYAYCDVDVVKENGAAVATARAMVHEMPFDAIIVPGFTQGDDDTLHPTARQRLVRAAIDFEDGMAPFIILSGGSVNGTNEALEMKRFLVERGFPRDRLLVEPCALHSHTNLRNTGRLMLSLGMSRGIIVTSFDQAFYFSHAFLTQLVRRQRAQLGDLVGRVSRWDDYRVMFTPWTSSFAVGEDPLDP